MSRAAPTDRRGGKETRRRNVEVGKGTGERAGRVLAAGGRGPKSAYRQSLNVNHAYNKEKRKKNESETPYITACRRGIERSGNRELHYSSKLSQQRRNRK